MQAGDLDGARAAALDADLVGSWTVDALKAHPGLAGAVDGRRRGYTVDRAVDRLAGIVRDHVPNDPGTFAACADACHWAEAVEGDATGPRAAGRLIQAMKGRWAKSTAACEAAAATAEGRPPTPEMVGWLFLAMYGSFKSDITGPALQLRDGAAGPRNQYAACCADGRHIQAQLLMAYKGMPAADRIRHAIRFAQALPAIRSVNGNHPDTWLGKAVFSLDSPWLPISRTEEVRPLVLGSSFSLDAWRRRRSDADDLGWLWMPALTPDGQVSILYEQRQRDGGRIRETRRMTPYLNRYRRVLRAFAKASRVKDLDTLGDVILERYGLAERAEREAGEAANMRVERFAAMLRAWGHALPRRFRRLTPEAAVACIAAEHAAMLLVDPEAQ